MINITIIISTLLSNSDENMTIVFLLCISIKQIWEYTHKLSRLHVFPSDILRFAVSLYPDHDVSIPFSHPYVHMQSKIIIRDGLIEINISSIFFLSFGQINIICHLYTVCEKQFRTALKYHFQLKMLRHASQTKYIFRQISQV